MGLDAVSWTDGSNQRQRVFFVQGGGVYQFKFDDDLASTPGLISFGAQALGYTSQSTDVGAVLFPVTGSQGIAVATGATLGGQSGYICIFESTDGGANFSSTCSTDRPLPSSNHDIVGVIANGSSTPEFYFENGFATLSRARRTATNTWVWHEEINVPTLVSTSLVATPSQASVGNKITLGFIGSDNRVHSIRINPTDFPQATDWQTQVALPGGVTPFTSKAALGGVSYHGTTGGMP